MDPLSPTQPPSKIIPMRVTATRYGIHGCPSPVPAGTMLWVTIDGDWTIIEDTDKYVLASRACSLGDFVNIPKMPQAFIDKIMTQRWVIRQYADDLAQLFMTDLLQPAPGGQYKPSRWQRWVLRMV